MWSYYISLHPDMYHGTHQKPPFFEGWYFKVVSPDESQRYAIVPGVILGANGHAFIQVLNGSTGASAYHTFPLQDFWASKDDFEIRIGPNRFSRDRISLQIDNSQGKVQGELQFDGITPWPVSVMSPGIMGWYAWVPRMECYHGVVSLDHSIGGSLTIDDQHLDFTQGRGYIEKDWGQSFPEAYIWFQSNHFAQPGTCITGSVAIIPWLRNAFRGFIIGVWHAGRLYRFATYTGASIERLELFDDHVDWIVRSRDHRLEMHVTRAQGGLLLGPNRAEMGRRVNETLLASIKIRLSSLSGKLVFAGTGRHGGLEAHGDLDRLLKMK
jgi:tocopherol cyclase